MTNQEKIKEDLPLHHTSTPFFNFSESSSPGELIKIYSPHPFKREEGELWGPTLQNTRERLLLISPAKYKMYFFKTKSKKCLELQERVV